MKQHVQEIYSTNATFKALVIQRSITVFSIDIFKRNTGIISGYGRVHDPMWEQVAGPLFVDTVERAQKLVAQEFERFVTS